jgi:GT2 family glycosyltransferase
MSDPLVYTVVLNYNGWRDTLECLASLDTLTYANHQVVVVDNASPDGSEAELRQARPDVTLLQSGANLGYAGGNNVGIRYALAGGADHVWILNNDTLVEPDALTQSVARMAQRPDAGMCGSKLVYHHDRSTVQAWGGASYNRWLGTIRLLGHGEAATRAVDLGALERQLDYIVGASLLVSRPFLEAIGLLREDYFLYFEELDWALRAHGRFGVIVAPESVVYHKEGASIGGNQHSGSKSRLADYYAIRNRLLITRRFFPYALPTVYLGLIPTLLNRARRGQWDRIPMILNIALGRNWHERAAFEVTSSRDT